MRILWEWQVPYTCLFANLDDIHSWLHITTKRMRWKLLRWPDWHGWKQNLSYQANQVNLFLWMENVESLQDSCVILSQTNQVHTHAHSQRHPIWAKYLITWASWTRIWNSATSMCGSAQDVTLLKSCKSWWPATQHAQARPVFSCVHMRLLNMIPKLCCWIRHAADGACWIHM